MTLKITEDAKSDISTVFATLAVPETHPNGSPKRVHSFTCFSDHYSPGAEREFIEALDEVNPGKYLSYHIMWSNCN